MRKEIKKSAEQVGNAIIQLNKIIHNDVVPQKVRDRTAHVKDDLEGSLEQLEDIRSMHIL